MDRRRRDFEARAKASIIASHRQRKDWQLRLLRTRSKAETLDEQPLQHETHLRRGGLGRFGLKSNRAESIQSGPPTTC